MKFKKILEEAAQKYAFQPNKETNPPHDKDYHQKEPVQFKKPAEVPDGKDEKLPPAKDGQKDVLDRMEDTAELANDYDRECVAPEGQDYAVNENDAQQLRRMITRLHESVNEDKWMQKAFAHNKGGLHRALDVPQGEKIPQDKLDAAKHSDNPHTRHMAQAAANANEGALGEDESRFDKLKGKLAHRKGVTNPAGLAAYIGREKYGAKKFAKMAHEDTSYDRGTDIENPPVEPASPIAGAAPMPNDPDAPVNSDSNSRIALKSIVKQMIQKYGLDSVISAVEKVKGDTDPSVAAEPLVQTEPDNLEPTQNDEE